MQKFCFILPLLAAAGEVLAYSPEASCDLRSRRPRWVRPSFQNSFSSKIAKTSGRRRPRCSSCSWNVANLTDVTATCFYSGIQTDHTYPWISIKILKS